MDKLTWITLIFRVVKTVYRFFVPAKGGDDNAA